MAKAGNKNEQNQQIEILENELEEVRERADQVERELKAAKQSPESVETRHYEAIDESPHDSQMTALGSQNVESGITELRKDSMMAHLLDSLEAKKDIGHYGRLVFAMVSRHLLPEESVVDWLQKDSDFSAEAAASLLRQVEGRDYNPPKRERILEWQAEQDFPIMPNPSDPDCGNLYRNLKFPEGVYKHIEQYQEEKVSAA